MLAKQKQLDELNEMSGITPHKYQKMFNIPDEPWRAGAIWDRGYFDAAKFLVEGVLTRGLFKGVHGVVGLYTFRHYVELQLKYILLYSRFLKDPNTLAEDAKAIRKTHSLDSLWQEIKKEVPAKLPDGVWKNFDTAFIDELIEELQAVDKNGESFRYAGAEFADSESFVMNELDVNYELLLAQMQHTFNVLHSIASYLYETHGQILDFQSEMSNW